LNKHQLFNYTSSVPKKKRVTFFGFGYAEKNLILNNIIFWEKAMLCLVSFLTFFQNLNVDKIGSRSEL